MEEDEEDLSAAKGPTKMTVRPFLRAFLFATFFYDDDDDAIEKCFDTNRLTDKEYARCFFIVLSSSRQRVSASRPDNAGDDRERRDGGPGETVPRRNGREYPARRDERTGEN